MEPKIQASLPDQLKSLIFSKIDLGDRVSVILLWVSSICMREWAGVDYVVSVVYGETTSCTLIRNCRKYRNWNLPKEPKYIIKVVVGADIGPWFVASKIHCFFSDTLNSQLAVFLVLCCWITCWWLLLAKRVITYIDRLLNMYIHSQ